MKLNSNFPMVRKLNFLTKYNGYANMGNGILYLKNLVE